MTTPQPAPTGDLPPAAAAELARIRQSLPPGWRVARIQPDAGGGWVAELVNETGQAMAEIALLGG